MFCSFNYHVLVTLSFFFAAVLAINIQVRSEYAIKEIHNVPRKWTRVGRAPADHMINLQIGLKQSRFRELERHLWEVSDPNHRRYGQHLSESEVRNLVRPTDECLMHVHQWLLDHDITEDQLTYSPARDWIGATLTISAVERLLNTEYSVFQNSEDGSYLVRAPQWSLPRHLHGHVDAIQPTNSFFRPHPKNKRSVRVASAATGGIMGNVAATEIDPALAAACNGTTMTPNCLRTINYTPKSLDKNQIGLTNYIGEINNRSDVSVFLQTLRPDAVAGATEFKTILVEGGEDIQAPLSAADITAGRGKEGNLDMETVLGISYPIKVTAWTTGGTAPNFIADLRTPTNSNEPYLAWLNFVINQTDLPQVISTSYADDEQTIPLSYATAVCNGFAQLGARGITLLFSSGDEGVGANGACVSNDGRNASTFLPVFPASCPYVTAVGGTRNVAPEIVAFDELNGFVSGGGFSSYFARPAYQDNAVPQYVSSLGNQFSGQFNTSGRGYPDIAAQGFRYAVAYNGAFINLDGTSASAPTAASVITLVNDALIAAGKPVMGFMNPWLYAQGNKAFTDITNGSAIGCNTTGFPAVAGWDAVTGFGTPSFQKIQSAVLNNATA